MPMDVYIEVDRCWKLKLKCQKICPNGLLRLCCRLVTRFFWLSQLFPGTSGQFFKMGKTNSRIWGKQNPENSSNILSRCWSENLEVIFPRMLWVFSKRGPLGFFRWKQRMKKSLPSDILVADLSLIKFSETIRHRWCQAGSKYWFLGLGFDSGPNLKPCYMSFFSIKHEIRIAVFLKKPGYLLQIRCFSVWLILSVYTSYWRVLRSPQHQEKT